jgi:tetratricopeptide (TPR) repeat protein
MKKFLTLLISVMFGILSMYSADNKILFEQANNEYKKASYDSAIVIYQNILKSGSESAELYFNLGNAYYKKKDIANAILNYERAKLLSPNDEEINFNLQLSQTLIVDKINMLPEFFIKRWWRNFSEMFSSDSWAWISIMLFIVTILTLALYLFSNRLVVKKLSFTCAVIFLLFSIISFSHSYRLKHINESKSSAIVMSASVTIKSSPDETGTELFVLHEGAKVWVVDEVGEWLRVKIADGNNGWLKREDVERI